MAGQDDKKEEKRTPEENIENAIADILKEKNVTWNEANKKVRNRKESAKFVRE